MKGREHEVTCFRGFDAGINSFHVTHFPDHNDIRIHTQSGLQCRVETIRVNTYFSLDDTAFLRGKEKLYRVFDGDQVVTVVLVDEVEHGSQSCRFAVAGGTRDEYKAVRYRCDFLKNGWQVQFLE